MAVASVLPYRPVQSGASLLLSFRAPERQSILVFEPNPSTSGRIHSLLEADFRVIVVSNSIVDPELGYRIQNDGVEWVELDISDTASESEWDHVFADLARRGHLAEASLALLGDTYIHAGVRRSEESAQAFRRSARKLRLQINVADYPALSDFAWCVSHRFGASSLQVAVSTNASGCRIASRIKREIVSALPASIGEGVDRISQLRRELKDADGSESVEGVEGVGALETNTVAYSRNDGENAGPAHSGEDSEGGRIHAIPGSPSSASLRSGSRSVSRSVSPHINSPVPQNSQLSRMKTIAQISEYWPLDRLCTATLADLDNGPGPALQKTQHTLSPPKNGRIILLGTGPGNPLLLTHLAYLLLTCSDEQSPFYVDEFLSDKLVPSTILDLIQPASRRAKVSIAKKFPGNADRAQEEFTDLALRYAREGKTVVRLKQGDPYLYGRGGEEYIRFSAEGFVPTVVPGMSSSLCAPLLANIPVTQRGVADSLIVTTGVKKGGAQNQVEPYSKSKTLVLLMGLARIHSIVDQLLTEGHYPPGIPVAVVERASLKDQRTIKTTLAEVASVLDSLEERPPGLLVVGWAVAYLENEFIVEGLPAGWAELSECFSEQG